MERPIDEPPRLPDHFPMLDGMRGVAIVVVVAHQLNHLGGTDLLSRLADHVLVGGWAGVQLFFVLSGFLITGILLDSRASPEYFRSFYVRRILRIFPLYYGALVLFFVVLPALGAMPAIPGDHQAWYWFYLSNWVQWNWKDGPPHFWSLAVEEQFYLLWPLLVHSRSPRELLRLCAWLAAASFLARVAMLVVDTPPMAIYMSSVGRVDALVAGAAMAALLRTPGWMARLQALGNPQTLLAASGIVAIGLEVAFGYHAYTPLGQSVGYTLLSAIFALTILAAALCDANPSRPGTVARALRSAPMRAFGRYSFGMYVFHKPIADLLGDPALRALGYPDRVPLPVQIAHVIVTGGVILAAGMLSYWLYERHFLALKKHFAPRLKAQGNP